MDLDPADLDILELDAPRLHQDLATAFAVQTAPGQSRAGRVARLGEHGVAAGLAAPVLLVLPGPAQPLVEEELRLGGLGAERSVVLAPTAAALPASLRARLSSKGHLVLDVAAITTADAEGGLTLVQPVEILLNDVRAHLLARARAARPGPSIMLPSGTGWEQVTFTLTSSATASCSAHSVTRQLDPGALGMRSAKNDRPTNAWALFVVLIAGGGKLQIMDQRKRSAVMKQKQTLGRVDKPDPQSDGGECREAEEALGGLVV
ncbi:hypothetical protein GXW77_20770, partial [Roseomonas alkaliterrae]